MKKVLLESVSENIRYPLTTLFGQHIQEAYTEIVDALVKGLIEDPAGLTILNGCVISGASPNFTVTSGAVYYQGEIFLVDSRTVNVPSGQVLLWTIEETWRAGDPVVFSDNIPRNAHLIRKMKLAAGRSGSGVVDHSSVNRLSKANRVQSEWIDLPGATRHPSAIFGQSPNLIPSPAFMKDEMGFVHLRSVVEVSSSNGVTISTLPEGYRPESTFNIRVAEGGNSSSKIWPDGRIVVDTTQSYFILDGIIFKAAE